MATKSQYGSGLAAKRAAGLRNATLAKKFGHHKGKGKKPKGGGS
jgi:hypothetical protein